MSDRDRFNRFDDYLDRATDRHAFPESDPDADAKIDKAAGDLADDLQRRRARGENYERRAAERNRAALIEKRHELANKATVARLQADEMFLEIKRLDAEIDALRREP